METEVLKRINELAHIAKERALSPEELEERDRLRQEYLKGFRANACAVLNNVVVQTPDGKKHKLQRKNLKK